MKHYLISLVSKRIRMVFQLSMGLWILLVGASFFLNWWQVDIRNSVRGSLPFTPYVEAVWHSQTFLAIAHGVIGGLGLLWMWFCKCALKQDRIEQKRTLERLKKSENRFRELVDMLPEAVCETDQNIDLIFANRRGFELFGYSAEELKHGLSGLKLISPEDRERAKENLARRLKGERFPANEYKAMRKDGSTFPMLFHVDPVMSESKLIGFRGVAIDITERKRSEETLKTAHRELEAALVKTRAMASEAKKANRAKSLFLSNMSHEIRTPLNAVLGFSQILATDPSLTSLQRRHVKTISRSGTSLMQIINDILEISRIETGSATVNPATFCMSDLLDDIQRMFHLKCDEKGLYLTITQDEHLPDFLYGDENKLKQVLVNLLSNAVKFTTAGGITLRMQEKLPREKVDSLRLIVDVEDTGIGICEEDIKKLFSPFTQVDAGRKKGGTGLGLSISRGFARLMGGDLHVQSEPGRGSFFRLEVMMQEGECQPETEQSAPRSIVGLEPRTGPIRILVVDDTVENLMLLKALLEPVGFEVHEAANGKEALAQFDRWSPHAVLMDLRMPEMDGYEATRRIRRTEAGRTTPVIALTASAFEGGKQQLEDAGVNAYIRKPFDSGELFEVIGGCLGIRYVYEEDVKDESDDIAPDAVSVLPPEMTVKLKEALEEGNMIEFRELLELLAEDYPDVVRGLERFVETFDYEKLSALLEEEKE